MARIDFILEWNDVQKDHCCGYPVHCQEERNLKETA